MFQFNTKEFWTERIKQANGNFYDAMQGGVDWDKVQEEHTKIFAKHLEGKVLDAGCGIGLVIPCLPETVTEYTGMDISPDFLKEAKRRFPKHKFIEGNVMETPFKENEFDWVIARGMGGHPSEPPSAFFKNLRGELTRIGRSVIVLWNSKPTEYNIYHNDFYKHAAIKQGK